MATGMRLFGDHWKVIRPISAWHMEARRRKSRQCSAHCKHRFYKKEKIHKKTSRTIVKPVDLALIFTEIGPVVILIPVLVDAFL